MTDTKKANNKIKPTSTIARSDDGSIQITFTIPYSEIKENRLKATEELGKEMEIPGFRKGKAPTDKVIDSVDQNKLLEKTLAHILPKLLSDVITKNKLKPAIYPKFELIKANENEDWQIRAKTCELPEVKLGDYKKVIKDNIAPSKIWTPGKDKKDKELTNAEKEQLVLKALIESVEIDIPNMLIDEEANLKLSSLLQRIEKLGLNLDSYLASIGKTAESLRKEYKEQAKNGLVVDILLTKIAESESLTVNQKDIDAAITAAKADPNVASDIDSPQRKQFIESILRRRRALSFLVSLI